MKKKLSLLAVLLVVVTGVAIFTACRDDVILPPPPSLDGSYVGTYTYTEGEATETQGIKWVFTEASDKTGSYAMDADPWSPLYDSMVCFCKGRGSYSISDRVQLQSTTDRPEPDNCQTCNESRSPQGLFALNRAQGVELRASGTTGPETNQTPVSMTVDLQLGEPTLAGEFEGLYIRKAQASSDSIVQAVKFVYTADGFEIYPDTEAELYDPAVCFCRATGSYALTTRPPDHFLTLALDATEPSNCDSCDVSLAPNGEFELAESLLGMHSVVKIEQDYITILIMNRVGD